MTLLLVIIASVIIAFIVTTSKLKPLSNSRKKQSMSAYKAFKKFEKEQKRYRAQEKVTDWFQRLVEKNVPTYTKDRLKYIIFRLGLENITPERIFAQQIMYAVMCIAIGIACFPITVLHPMNYVLGIGFICGSILGYRAPISKYEKTIKIKNQHILDELFSFYSLICSTYQINFDTPVEEVVNTFMKGTTPDMKEELSILVINIQRLGTVRAFMELKKRIPTPYILRVCDTVITRFSTMTDNISTMLYLKEELKSNRYIKLQKKLDKKVKRVDMSQIVLFIILILFILLHLYFQSYNSIQLLKM